MFSHQPSGGPSLLMFCLGRGEVGQRAWRRLHTRKLLVFIENLSPLPRKIVSECANRMCNKQGWLVSSGMGSL